MTRSWIPGSTRTVDLGEEQLLLICSERYIGVLYRGAWLREPFTQSRTHEPSIGCVRIRSPRPLGVLRVAKRVAHNARAAFREMSRLFDAVRTDLEAAASMRSKPSAE
jgi:hypothetical protein